MRRLVDSRMSMSVSTVDTPAAAKRSITAKSDLEYCIVPSAIVTDR